MSKTSCSSSFIVPMRVGPVPSPGGLDDRSDLRVSWLPPQFTAGMARIGHKRRRIAGARTGHLGGDRQPRYLAAGLDDLAHARSPPGSQVELELDAPLQPLERGLVRRGEVIDVNVIADAGPVRSRVLVSKDRHMLTLSKCDLEDQRNQVSLGIVVFAQVAIGRGAGRVEVTQGSITPAIGMGIVGQSVLDDELGESVRIDRALRLALAD